MFIKWIIGGQGSPNLWFFPSKKGDLSMMDKLSQEWWNIVSHIIKQWIHHLLSLCQKSLISKQKVIQKTL